MPIIKLTGYPTPEDAQRTADTINESAAQDAGRKSAAFEHLKTLHGHLMDLAMSVPHPAIFPAITAVEQAQQKHDAGDFDGAHAHVSPIAKSLAPVQRALTGALDPSGELSAKVGSAIEAAGKYSTSLKPAAVKTPTNRLKADSSTRKVRYGVSVSPSFYEDSPVMSANRQKQREDALRYSQLKEKK